MIAKTKDRTTDKDKEEEKDTEEEEEERMSGGTSQSATLKPLPKDTIRKICAGQVVLDVSSAVKELIE